VYGICKLSVGISPKAFTRGLKQDFPERDWREAARHPVLDSAASQLEGYFERRIRTFDLPLDLRGSPFQRAVWESVRRIPWGEARSYQQVAAMIGRPKAMRAVGNAMNSCPLAIVIPCHRVTGAGGRLGGWGGDLRGKKMLLDFEGIAYR
jgi:methylated-DNA-[protein]-cysteine S-methyltransferase